MSWPNKPANWLPAATLTSISWFLDFISASIDALFSAVISPSNCFLSL